MSITETLFTTITHFMSTGGYGALFVLTTLDSTVLPLPNETFMPFVGVLIESGRFSFWAVLAISSVGAILGSLTSYAIGYYGTEPFVKRWGKWFRIKIGDIEKTHKLFEKYGERIILISRFIPLVRQFVSIPAGAAKMKLGKFIVFNAIGSTLWNSAILGLGYILGANSARLEAYTSLLDKALLAGALLFLLYIWYRKRKKN